MHHFYVHESCESSSTIALRDGGGRFHMARATASLLPVGTELEGMSALRGRRSLTAAAALEYASGLRYAGDLDHIAVIHNPVRISVESKREPPAVGMWFALGHSTVEWPGLWLSSIKCLDAPIRKATLGRNRSSAVLP